MPDFTQLVSTLREQMSATLSRSDALKPLAWLTGILTLATVLMLYAQAPQWLLLVMAILLVCSAVLYAWAYGYCLLYDRDALRSEKYSLNKMAIEHGLIGDSATGLFKTEDLTQPAVPDSQTKQIEHKQ
jgi:hypothetical protein